MPKFIDLTGQVFGRLTVVSRVENNSGNRFQWLCHCSCGNDVKVISDSLRTGNTQSCGCISLEDLTGRVFGKLTVEKYLKNENGKRIWLCRCECKNVREVETSYLIANRIVSCGCANRTTFIDLTGMKFGKLTALKIDKEEINKSGTKYTYWLCKCDCNKETSVDGNALRSGHTKSCGCENHKIKDITGQRFGKLIAKKYLYTERKKYENGEYSVVYWLCDCDCKKTAICDSRGLLKGNIKSCGCLHDGSKASFNEIFSKYRVGAKKRNLEFSLDKEEFKLFIDANCHYCGAEPSQIAKSGIPYLYNGIDRIDSLIGYTKDNLVTSCIKCNRMKAAISYDEFIFNIFSIYLNMKNITGKYLILNDVPYIVFETKPNGFRELYNRYKRESEKRGINFNLQENVFGQLTSGNCYYCGKKPLQLSGKNYKIPYIYNGIDRINNDRGYEVDNIVPCCGNCNKMKSNLSLDDFTSHILKIVSNLNL